jgi:hypothetical protein
MSSGEERFEHLEPVLCDLVVDVFMGDTDAEQNYHGKGTMKMKNGCNYNGDIKTGLFHGKGVFQWPNGVQYDGTFQDGTIDGKGVFKWPDGSKYTGDVKNGKRSGFGVFHCGAGQIYEGEWIDGQRHGKGTASYHEQKDTTVYSGDWVQGLRQGYGIMKYASGNIYEGHWHADKKAGMGLMIWKDLDHVYAGEWKDDLPHGKGENLWANMSLSKLMTKQMSSIYRGEWNSGMKHGDGAFFYADGSQYWGSWNNDGKDGNGVIQHNDGRILTTKFVNGQNILEPTPVAPTHEKSGKKHHTAHDKHNHVSPSSKGDTSATSDVKLHIKDMLLSLPKANSNLNPGTDYVTSARVFSNDAHASAASSKGPSNTGENDKEAKELERLLLRFNTSLKQIHTKLVESSDKDKRRHVVLNELTANPLDFSKMDSAIAIALTNHQKFFSMSLRELKAYCRELGLYGCHFSSQHVTDALIRAIEEQKACAATSYVKQQLADRKAARDAVVTASAPLSRVATPVDLYHADKKMHHSHTEEQPEISQPEINNDDIELRPSTELLSEVEVQPPKFPDVWGQRIGPSSMTRSTYDIDQPICEQNFYNVLVRCVIQSDLYQTATSPVYTPGMELPDIPMGLDATAGSVRMPLELFKATLMKLKEIHVRYENKPELPPLLAAIVADETQSLLNEPTNKQNLLKLWESVTNSAAADGVKNAKETSIAQFRHVVRLLQTLKGTHIRNSAKTSAIIRLLQTPHEAAAQDIPSVRPMTAVVPETVASTETAEVAPEGDDAPPSEVDAVATTDGGDEAPGTAAGTRPTTAAAPVSSTAIDHSSLLNLIDYDDFCDLFCKIVVSDMWCYVEPEPEPVDADDSAPVDGDGAVAETKTDGDKEETKPVESDAAEADPLPIDRALSKRLGIFFTNFDSIKI